VRKLRFALAVGCVWTLASAGVVASTATVASASTDFTTFSPPITGASDYAINFPGPACAGFGPVGMIDDGTTFFVSDNCNGTLYEFPAASGGDASTATAFADGLDFGLALSNKTYFGVGGGTLEIFNPITGAIISTVDDAATTIATCIPLDLAADPLSPDLYVSTINCGILRVQNPESATPTVTVFNNAAFYDGITFTADGQDLWAADKTNGAVAEINRSGTVVADIPVNFGVDGITVATAGAPGAANNVFVNDNDGTVYRIDTNNGDAVSSVASGGSRGDFAIVGPDGCMYVTQSDRVEKLAPCIFQPTPTGGVAPDTSAVIEVETGAAFAGDTVDISSAQLQASCDSVTFETLQKGSPSAPTVQNNNITVVLDDDGNVTVVVNGVECSPGTDLIEADLTGAPYLTATTTVVIDAPQVTPAGVTGYPANEVETGNSPASGDSDVYTVFYVETSPTYAEQTVVISSPQLVNRCGLGTRWETNSGAAPFIDSPTALATLDDDGNATFVFKGASCAAGDSTVTADINAGTHTTYSTTYTIAAPQVTVAGVRMATTTKHHHRRHRHHGGTTSPGPAAMTVTASPNPLVLVGG